MTDLLARLVQAPTILGNEEPGSGSWRRRCARLGLDPVDVPMDADALRAHPQAAPFDWDVEGKRNVVATWEPGVAGGRPVADPERTYRRGEPGAAARSGAIATRSAASTRTAGSTGGARPT